MTQFKTISAPKKEEEENRQPDLLNPDCQTFFSTRMQLLGVTSENNKIRLVNPEAEYPIPKIQERPIFSEDKKGNISITFYRIDRTIPTYFVNKMGNPREWKQKRLKEPKGDNKYDLPEGQGTFPFIPPNIIDAFENKTEVETLFLTEGAFKAWKASQHGIYCFGLTSITHYRDKETAGLHSDILKFIQVCQVKNVVVLWDADFSDISEKQLSLKEELFKRPNGFFSAVKTIRELMLESELVTNIFFGHIKRGCFVDDPKGLDDILIESEKENCTEELVEALANIEKHNPYFHFSKINSERSLDNLKSYFSLNSVNAFYERHKKQIGLLEFVFKRSVYQWNQDKESLEEREPLWVKNYRWIGDHFFEILKHVDAKGEIAGEKIVRRMEKTIAAEHGRDFLKYFKGKRFKGFTNVPDNFDYKESIHGFYNRYSPLDYKPKEGDISNTLAMIRHIFGEEEVEHNGKKIPRWELGLDYCQILITEPVRKLPVLILFSRENNTGKSTLPDYLKAVLGANAVKVASNQFSYGHNEVFADRILVYCDETLLEKKAQSEVIKDLSTAKIINVNPKGRDQYELPFFAKFIFTTNNPKPVYVDSNDQRFWILEVPVLGEKVDVDFEVKLKAEIPAFLHFLKNRQLISKRESRMHFHNELIKTDAWRKVVEENEPGDARHLREHIREMFSIEENGDEILMPKKNVREEFFGNGKELSWIKEILENVLNVRMLDTAKDKTTRGSYWKYDKPEKKILTDGSSLKILDTEYETRLVKVNFVGRPYVFKKEDFV